MNFWEYINKVYNLNENNFYKTAMQERERLQVEWINYKAHFEANK